MLKSRNLFWRIILNKFTIATLVFILLAGFIDTNSLIELVRTNRVLKSQEQKIEELDNRIETAARKLNALRSSKDSLERFAREEHLYCADGEDVYVLE
ncbi:MAG: septum formation initiator family protein [Bacteroidales bacterium]|nr:septum formation initiator family protein [Candidatus Cacconaster merdequi]